MDAVFEFSRKKDAIFETLGESRRFAKVISFQLTSPKVAQVLSDLAGEGIQVEVITLPPDSYKDEEERENISNLYHNMKEKGVNLLLCDWEVGDPSLTATSLSGELAEGGGAKWYSLHGKFIVTEQCALACSANLTDEVQLEVFLKLRNKEAIDNFSSKFEQMKSLFIEPASTNPRVKGRIYDHLDPIGRELVDGGLETGQKIIREYPPDLSPMGQLKEGLFLAPFDGQARDYVSQLVEEAREFVSIASERFFDDQLVGELRKKAVTTKCQMRILAGPPRGVRQNPTKARLFAAELLAAGVEFHVLSDIHAKMWISDQWLMIGSPSLTKMNLGFYKKKGQWRANTETLFFSRDKDLIKQAKTEFDEAFGKVISVLQEMADEGSNLEESKSLFELFGAKSQKEVRSALSRIEISMKIGSKTNLITIARLASKLANAMNAKYVEVHHVTMALIMFVLQQRRHDISDLKERLANYIDDELVSAAVQNLLQLEYVLESEGTYMINIDKIV